MPPPIVWTPSPERIASATITRYREWLNETRGLALADYADLWQWSVDELEAFWASIWAKRSTTLRTPNSGAQLDHVAPMLAQPRKAAIVSGMFGR